MFERIIEIIVYMIAEMKHKKSLFDINVKDLKELGYTNSEISTAFSWIADNAELEPEKLKISTDRPGAFRILHDGEIDLFTKEAYGDLLQYHTLGLVSNEQIEAIIERVVLTSHSRLDRNQLKSLMADILFESAQNSLDSNRFMLRGNETIN